MKINRSVLQNLCALSKEFHPREVGGILLGRNVINDFVMMPGKFSYGEVLVNMYDVPIYPNMAGTFHSHPTPDARPSRADLSFFSRWGRIHLIIGAPYDLNSVKAYDPQGKPVDVVIE